MNYVKVFYLADDEITVFFGVGVIKNGDINDNVKCMRTRVLIEDMIYRVEPDDNVADILVYRN